MDVSGNLHFLKGCQAKFLYKIWNAGWLWNQCRGNALQFELIWGTPTYFAFLRLHQCSSRLVTVFLGIFWSSIKEIDVPYAFDWGQGIPLHAMQGNSASSFSEVEVSCVFSSCGRHLGYILELRWGWPFETQVCSAKSGLLCSYDGHLRNLN